MKSTSFVVSLIAALSSACALQGGSINIPTTPTRTPVYGFGIVVCGVPVPVTDPCPVPIAGAAVGLHESQDADYLTQTSNADGYTYFTSVLPYSDVKISAPGYVDAALSIQPPAIDGDNLSVVLVPVIPPWPRPASRAPLVLEGNNALGMVCPQTPIVTVPAGPDRRFWRTDAWGVTVPGAPLIAGGNGRHPERILSWFFDRYPTDAQRQILEANRRDGYTHFTLSWPDSRVSGGIDNGGQTPQQFAATAVVVHQAIPYVHVMLTSKYFDAEGADADERMAAVSPAIDALIAAGFTGEDLILGVGWELDLFNEGQRLENFIHALHAKYPQFDLYAHFTTYKTSWQPDGHPRAQFWEATQGELTGLLYQGNPSDDCGLMAAHFNDAQIEPSGLRAAGAILVPWELVAESEYDNDHPNEDEANARVWSIMQTPGAILANGGGNGWRFPDGRPALASFPVQR